MFLLVNGLSDGTDRQRVLNCTIELTKRTLKGLSDPTVASGNKNIC